MASLEIIMPKKYFVATLQNLTPVPVGSIWRDDGVFDFVAEDEPQNIKEKLSEYDDQKKIVYKKKGLKIKGRAEK